MTPDQVDFEDFLGFLDIEHYLGLRGSDTWSADGNESQVLVKTLIAQILAERIPTVDAIDSLYLKFAEMLEPDDLVLTFNYDILLERALDRVGKPYRLFPSRYTSVGKWGATVDSSRDEVIVLKLHGSIDWFDRRDYRLQEEEFSRNGVSGKPAHPIFNNSGVRVSPLVAGPRFSDDPLAEMYRLVDVTQVYENPPLFRATPYLLNPSSMKLLHSSGTKNFYWGLGGVGILNFRMAIIGYSMPKHDEYTRQIIYRLVSNYQNNYWDNGYDGRKKAPLVVIDRLSSEADKQNFRNRYAFVDWQKTLTCFDGFTQDVIRKL